MELACHCTNLYLDYGVDPSSGLPFHAVILPENKPDGALFWTRGSGWLCLALGILIRYHAPGEDRYKQSLVKLFLGLKSYAVDFLFSGFVTRKYPLDTSGTSMVCLGMVWGGIDMPVDNVLNAIISRSDAHGMILSSLGDSYGINYYAHSYGYTSFAQAYTVMLIGEQKGYKDSYIK